MTAGAGFRAILAASAIALAAAGAPGFWTAPTAMAQAAGDLKGAKAAGLVGERPDGLIGAVSATPSADVAALVESVNRARQAQYAKIAAQNQVPAAQVGAVAGKELISRTPAGQFVLDGAGRWVRK